MTGTVCSAADCANPASEAVDGPAPKRVLLCDACRSDRGDRAQMTVTPIPLVALMIVALGVLVASQIAGQIDGPVDEGVVVLLVGLIVGGGYAFLAVALVPAVAGLLGGGGDHRE